MRIPLHYTWRSMQERAWRCLLTAGGVGVAVFVSVTMLALSRGVMENTRRTAAPNAVVILSKGAEAMEFSAVEPSDWHRIKNAPQILQEEGEPLASPEMLVTSYVHVHEGPLRGEFRGSLRGILPIALKVHPIVITRGRKPERNFELMAGQLTAAKLGVPPSVLDLGRSVEIEGRRWTIVGHFTAKGSSLESEFWASLEDVATATRRTDYSTVVVMARDAGSADDLVFDLTMRTDVRVEAKSATAYYEASARLLQPVETVSFLMTALLVGAAVMAGMNTMFASILGRTREMGTLLVLGYRRSWVLMAFTLESIALCMAGGLLGAALGSLLNDFPMKIPMGAFRFVVDATTLGTGMALALFIGLTGATIPVLRVARLPIVEALRAR